MKKLEMAVLGGGCFWCTEAIFKRVKGVKAVIPGYTGGNVMDPSYHQVCAGNTGHAEVVRISYDPVIITFEDLLTVFWHAHDPTTLNRQGNDIGSQYRSIILYADESQREQAEASLKAMDASGVYRQPIVTEIKPLEKFYPAEDYHHDYFAQNPNQPYCQAVIAPKVQHFLEVQPEKLA